MVEDKPLRVLIADDEPLAAERLQLLLARAQGAQLVGTASDGDSAIHLTEAFHPDVLLLDIAMPGLDGIGVARALAAQDVDRVSAERDYMRLHVGRRSWLIHHSMAALEEGLNPDLFVRLHRSAIVRKDFITGFTRNPSGRWIARLGDGTEQPVGRLYSDRVRAIAGR